MTQSRCRLDLQVSNQPPSMHSFLRKLGTQVVTFLAIVSILFIGAGSNTAQAAGVNSLFPSSDSNNFVTAVVERVEGAVVQVNVSRAMGGDIPAALRPFLGRPQGRSPQSVLRGIGSGFVISSANSMGQIITNAHVVDNADMVTVSFQDGRILEGKVLGKDLVTDVAVIEVQGDNLPAVSVGDSDKVRQGQWAIAIGNPLGLQETVTVGVISGTERSSADIGVPDKRVGFLQTDAAINPGNSGGPLLNAQGEVIGVNTAIIRGTQGLGFAIPINTVQSVARQLIATGTVQHPYIGVQMVALTPQVKQFVNQAPNSKIRVEEDNGILVVQVGKGTPAAKAGLRAGDVISEVNQQPMNKVNILQRLVDQVGVNGQLDVTVKRDDRLVALKISPEQLPMAEAQ
ncbi:MAG: trypsin-like peptidase domain-containing protein [Candidatus Parcubacteria bacterium]|nr:trypsin-like peptidase domain-containing protein [Leptolyngbyaceae cyanobacterium LF-bin-113]